MTKKWLETWHLRSITKHDIGCDLEHNIWHVLIMNVSERTFTAFTVQKDETLWANREEICNEVLKNIFIFTYKYTNTGLVVTNYFTIIATQFYKLQLTFSCTYQEGRHWDRSLFPASVSECFARTSSLLIGTGLGHQPAPWSYFQSSHNHVQHSTTSLYNGTYF